MVKVPDWSLLDELVAWWPRLQPESTTTLLSKSVGPRAPLTSLGPAAADLPAQGSSEGGASKPNQRFFSSAAQLSYVCKHVSADKAQILSIWC